MHLTPRNAEPKLQIMTNPFELVSDTHKATHTHTHTHTLTHLHGMHHIIFTATATKGQPSEMQLSYF